MAFVVKAPPGVCDAPTEPTTCDLPIGTEFTLSVEIIDPPAEGYDTVQVHVSYFDLIYQPTTFAIEEWVWPDVQGGGRTPPVVTGNEGFVSTLASTSGNPPLPLSFHEGNLTEFSMRCTNAASSTDVVLPIYSAQNTFGAAISRVDFPFDVRTFPKPIGQRLAVLPGGNQQEVDVADELTINCLDSLPTFTPTPPGPTAIPTPTAEPPKAQPGMALIVKSGGVCDDAEKPTSCDVLIGSTFTLAVETNDRPVEGYESFQTLLDLDGMLYSPTTFAIDEILWPECALPLRSPGEPPVGHACTSALVPPFPISKYSGNIVATTVGCGATVASHDVRLVPFAFLGTTAGAGYRLPPTPLGSREIIPASDSLTINCVQALPTPVPTPGSVGGAGVVPGAAGASSAWNDVLAVGGILGAAALAGAALVRVRTRRA